MPNENLDLEPFACFGSYRDVQYFKQDSECFIKFPNPGRRMEEHGPRLSDFVLVFGNP